MTEYELGEMLYNTYENLWNSAQMYFTLVSAYLITGYLVVAKLTTQQNRIVTGLYLVWILQVIYNQFATLSSTSIITKQLYAMNSVLTAFAPEQTYITVYSFLFVQIAGVIASIYFMWGIRQHKAE